MDWGQHISEISSWGQEKKYVVQVTRPTLIFYLLP